ncbi:hypothetical protein [Methylophilus aquaticus]|uniref:Uncharacterized protein n=1 Tax=Methylophilus aquaticus TaxID=1971610 RepID=A0ABT9JTC1_9PROT|nr:hypothetical protein [Methylophilus aquaticus]MDP8567734.1 hypothetical protein [Methylophilus aquaticus]
MSERKKAQLYVALLVSICLLAITSLSLAEPPPRSKPDFTRMKQDTLLRLKTELTCVEAAQDENSLRACRPKPPQAGGHPDRSARPGNGVESNQYNLPEM